MGFHSLYKVSFQNLIGPGDYLSFSIIGSNMPILWRWGLDGRSRCDGPGPTGVFAPVPVPLSSIKIEVIWNRRRWSWHDRRNQTDQHKNEHTIDCIDSQLEVWERAQIDKQQSWDKRAWDRTWHNGWRWGIWMTLGIIMSLFSLRECGRIFKTSFTYRRIGTLVSHFLAGVYWAPASICSQSVKSSYAPPEEWLEWSECIRRRAWSHMSLDNSRCLKRDTSDEMEHGERNLVMVNLSAHRRHVKPTKFGLPTRSQCWQWSNYS